MQAILLCRYDVFRRAVIELPPPSREAMQESVRMLMHDPEAYQPDGRVALHWQVIFPSGFWSFQGVAATR